jgi:hypothetical protein
MTGSGGSQISPESSSAKAPPAPEAPSTTPAAPAQASPTTPAKPAPSRPPASKVLNYQFQAQINYYYCGPAATRIALTTRGVQPNQDEVASQLNTTVNGTDSADDTTRVLNSLGHTTFYRTRSIPGANATPAEMDRLQADVVRAITSRYPVVVNIDGSAVDTAGAWHAYPGGHYLTVVGYRDDGRTVKIADPANIGAGSSYWMTTIDLANWAAGKGYSA